MKTLSQNEQEVKHLIHRMDELEKSGDTDCFFRLATELERKVFQLCQMLFREIEKNNRDEMEKAAEFERLFVSRVQATLGTTGQVLTGVLAAGVTLAGAGLAVAGVAAGQHVATAGKAFEYVNKIFDNSNEAERVGHQHSQKLSGSLHDAYRQTINELNQSKHRTAQVEAESERSRHQVTAAPAA